MSIFSVISRMTASSSIPPGTTTTTTTAVPEGENTGDVHIYIRGDSNTNFLHTTGVMQDVINADPDADMYTLTIDGSAGATTFDLKIDWEAKLVAAYKPECSRNFLILFITTNDHNNSTYQGNPQAVKDNLIYMCETAVKIGYTLIFGIPSNAKNHWSSGWIGFEEEYVPWCLANAMTLLGVEAIINDADDPFIGTNYEFDGDPDYWSDVLHYSTPLGGTYRSTRILNAVKSLQNITRIIPPAPTNLVADDIANTLTATLPTGYTSDDVQYTWNKGLSLDWAPEWPLSVPYSRPDGYMGLRIGPKNGNAPSAWAFATTPFTGPGMPEEFVYSGDERYIYNVFDNQWYEGFNGVTWDQVGYRLPYITEGFKVVNIYSAYGTVNWEFRIKNVGDPDSSAVVVGSGLGGAPGHTIIEWHDTVNPTVLKELIFYKTNGGGAIYGITLYGA